MKKIKLAILVLSISVLAACSDTESSAQTVSEQDTVSADTTEDIEIPEQSPQAVLNEESGSSKTGTLADITNLDELVTCIANLEMPAYLEEKYAGEYMSLNSYGSEMPFFKVTKYNSLDDLRSYYAQYIDDSVLNLICRFYTEFALYKNELYSLDPNFGFVGLSVDQTELVRIEEDGDYIVKIPKKRSIADSEASECYEFAFRERNGTFYVAECLNVPYISDPEPSIGYAVVNVDGLNRRSEPSTSGEKLGKLNQGAVVDVYEIIKDSEFTWYRCSFKGNEWSEVFWIADSGSWLRYTEY